ncbi:MAG: stage II sporulation protein R [bacterium]|nr:stage II sporulation protein R [bacterium]
MKKKIFLILFLLLVINIYNQTDTISIIPDSSIRLRVIPNSNDSLDVNIKEQVKKYLEKDVYKLTKDSDSIEEARNIISSNIPYIEENISTIFLQNNYNLPFKVNYGDNFFPEKTYQGITYEEGMYESLAIYIGDAKGDNFWCVLFPNYCLVDTENNNNYKSYFKELFSKIF